MKEISLILNPEQYHRYRIIGQNLRLRFTYNYYADEWFVAIWKGDDDCPAMGDTKIIINRDAFKGKGLNAGEFFAVHASRYDRFRNNYDRFTQNGVHLVFTTYCERLKYTYLRDYPLSRHC